jgi:hypothetical protein
VPHAVPLRPVQTTPTLLQRSMDTEVLSRRWELRVLGFSHRSPGVPRKREKKSGRSYSGSVHRLHSISCHSHVAQAKSLESWDNSANNLFYSCSLLKSLL